MFTLNKVAVLLNISAMAFAAASVKSDHKGFKSLGCYTDSTQSRALRYRASTSNVMTVERCIDSCPAEYVLSGVEYGTECYCGNAILYNQQPADATSCNMSCAGDATEICGGPNRINMYHKGDTPYTSGVAKAVTAYKDWKALGCYQDSVNMRRIPNQILGSEASKMTVDMCLDGCQANKYNVAGLQYGQECWCGNVHLPPGQNDGDEACYFPCNGNANQICGAGDHNSIFYLPSAFKN